MDIIIYILGSIGAGKTSFTKLLHDNFNFPVHYEDVNNGLIKGMLNKFYNAGAESRKVYSPMLQVAFLTVRFKQLKTAIQQHNAVLDSNLLSDWIMANNLHNRGEMDDDCFNVYMNLNQEMQSIVNGFDFAYPDLIIYLDISKEHELEEIAKRGRDMEDVRHDAKLVDYYHSVNDAYSNWYNGAVQSPVLRIDRDKYDFVNNVNDRRITFQLVLDKLYTLGKLDKEEYDTFTQQNIKSNAPVEDNIDAKLISVHEIKKQD